MSYGITVNCSYVQDDDGKLHVGLNYSNSDGKEFNIEKTGDDLEDMLAEMYAEAVMKYIVGDEPEEEPELDVDFLMEENKQLREEVNFLRERLNKKEKKETPQEDDSYVSVLKTFFPELKYWVN